MTSTDLLTDAFGRVREAVHDAVDGLKPDQLGYRPDPSSNSIAWLVWHLTRIQDDHIAGVAGTEQAWTADGWADRFGLPFDTKATGYAQDAADAGEVRVESAELLTAYYDAVHERTLRFVATLTDSDLARVVDKRWDPPVTLAVRMLSVVADDLQHAGQAAYLRGMVERKAG